MVKNQFNSMKEQMDKASENQHGHSSGARDSERPNFDIGGEYIPFEEIKDQKKN
jgi:hypothetical protein